MASITLQISELRLEPLRYSVTNMYDLHDISEFPLDQIAKTDYLLHLGDHKQIIKNENILKPLWEHRNSPKQIWSLSKVIKNAT